MLPQDPPAGSPVDLPALARLWSRGADRQIEVVSGRRTAASPPGNRYVAFPPRRPRVLLPLEGRRSAAGALTGNLSLRRPRDRVRRRVLAWSVRTGVPQALLRSRWAGLQGDDAPGLLEALRAQWDPRAHALTFTIRSATPNYKPTFVVTDDRGHVLAYAKMSTNPGSAARVRCEADALCWLEQNPVEGLRAPRLLGRLVWRESEVVLVEPLPESAVRYPRDDTAPAMLVDDAVRRGRTRPAEEVAVALASTVASAEDAEVTDRARAYADRVLERHRGTPVVVGRTHGDWVPWNVARDAGETWAWDWEHSGEDEAVCLDLVHWHQFVARERLRHDLTASIGLAERRAARDLAVLGFTVEQRRALVALGRLHVAARAAGLYAASGRWAGTERSMVVGALAALPENVT
jgi:hypothetical protein